MRGDSKNRQRMILRAMESDAVAIAALVIASRSGVDSNQLPLETERAKGELKRGPVVTTRNHGDPPTLATLGLTKRESAERNCWRRCLRLPAHVL